MEKKPANNMTKNVLIAVGVCVSVYLFFSRSILVFLPVFAGVVYLLWKRGGGKVASAWEEDDPADWWKKGKSFGER